MKKISTMLALAAIVLLGGGMEQAQACCVYNHADYPASVSLDCGSFCQNDWEIGKDDHKCRPSKGGTVQANLEDYQGGFANTERCRVKVDAHGWVSIGTDSDSKGGYMYVHAKDKNGTITDSCHGRFK